MSLPGCRETSSLFQLQRKRRRANVHGEVCDKDKGGSGETEDADEGEAADLMLKVAEALEELGTDGVSKNN